MLRILASLLVAATTLAATNLAERPFRGQIASIAPPPGYVLHDPPTQPPLGTTYALVGAARADGTRPIVQITLLELPDDKTPDTFSQSMIAGVAKRRGNWKVQTSDLTLNGIKVKRHQWTGTAPTQGLAMRGIMLTGTSGKVGFSLHTQDLAKYAAQTLPIGEKSMATFRMRKAK